jgi:hypothetical protein
MFMLKRVFYLLAFSFVTLCANGQSLSTIANNGWANNSVNTVIFRKNSLTTFNNTQFAAYYDENQFVVLAKRSINTKKWTVQKTAYKGDASDAHKSISIMVDGDGFLHVVWGQHNNALNYAKSTSPQTLLLGAKQKMLGAKEGKVSYPEFYKLANGNLLFLYRDGGSGNGNLMMNQYDCKTQKWQRLQDNLIDGENQRNAYWQVFVDAKGTIHLSWVWRETPNVASNHDLCYAKSTDGGLTWQNSKGNNYQLPINASNAEYVFKIPQNSELINQTSMYADSEGNPFIATYWKDAGDTVPQYHVFYQNNSAWAVSKLNFRKTPFSLSGTGTKKIPISRPQLVVWNNENATAVALFFRDAERGNKVSVALCTDLNKANWKCEDVTRKSVGEWEPTYDTQLWQTKQRLDLFVQEVQQLDGEGKANAMPTKVQVITWKPKIDKKLTL